LPSYRWQCFECGFQFEARVPISKRNEKYPCPECESPCECLVPEGINGFFNKDVTGPVPQNTGISGLDAHIDRVIGTHAKQGWEAHDRRDMVKREALADLPPEEAGKKELAKNPDGSYRVMSPEEQAAHGRVLTIHNMAMKHRKSSKGSVS